MIDINKFSDEEKKLIQEAYEAGVDSVLNEIYEEAVFDLEMNADIYNEEKELRKRLPNHPSKLDPNKTDEEEGDRHLKAPTMKKHLPKKVEI